LEIAFLFGIGTVVLFLGYFQKSQEISPILALILAAGYRILPSLNYVTINIGHFRGSVALLNQINSLGLKLEIRLTDLEFKQVKSVQKTKRFEGDLYLENVCYHYPISKKNIFTNFSLVVKSGQTLLVQGLSGTGKTTLVSLATGSLTPQQGRIYMLNGDTQFDMDHTVTGISYLSQDVPLLDESFAYNIALEEHRETNSKLLQNVASKSGILDRILQTPMGFDTQIGENGSLLSAGERQRLGIARSLYFKPSLLILDEPTANLDPAAEAVVWDSLANIKSQCTVIIVSHRFVPEKVYDKKIDLQFLSVEN
jgi:ABC-type bacteriocin/lantibiotic exporter with double-glycine peptidase domain